MVSFGVVSEANISGVKIVEAKIVNNNNLGFTGVIVGTISGGSIVDCITSGEVIGKSSSGCIGGVIGRASNEMIIKNCGSNTKLYGGHQTRRNLRIWF